MKATVQCRDGFLFIAEEREGAMAWLPVRQTNQTEARALGGRSVTAVDSPEGTYVDEEGNVYQLMDKGETKPVAVEYLSGGEKSELEVLLEASLKDEKIPKPNGGSKRTHRKVRNSSQKARHVLQVVSAAAPESSSTEAPQRAEARSIAVNGEAAQNPRLNLRQKLAEVRRRIGYVQKRGHNERFNYSYVTAADIAGTMGDLLAELGVVVIPKLEDISYESVAGRGEPTRIARVVMAYTFADVDSGEQIVVKVAGQGLDPGDKAPYKAMTGALKYALLQCFLLATGDDPEDERPGGRLPTGDGEHPISPEEIRILKTLIDETGTDLERVLAYYKVTALEEMTETCYRRAVDVLNRKLAKQSQGGKARAKN